MAVLCAKCGTEVASGAQFCAVCGTPVGGPPAPAFAAVPQAAPAFTPVSMPVQPAAPSGPVYTPTASYPQTATPPPAKTGGALKIILIVVAIFVGIGILGAGAVGFMVWRVAHAIHSAANGQGVTLNTPGGAITTSGSKAFTADELGTDIYPGAESTTGSMRLNMPNGSMVTGAFLTSDSKDAVKDYYRAKFGSEASVFDTGNGAIISLRKGQEEAVTVTISSVPSESNGKTKFVIMHTKSTKSS
jgi:hypothetical protein